MGSQYFLPLAVCSLVCLLQVFRAGLGPLRAWLLQQPAYALGVYVLDTPSGVYAVPLGGSMEGFMEALQQVGVHCFYCFSILVCAFHVSARQGKRCIRWVHLASIV